MDTEQLSPRRESTSLNSGEHATGDISPAFTPVKTPAVTPAGTPASTLSPPPSGERAENSMATPGDGREARDTSPCVLLAVDHSMQAEAAVQHYLDFLHRKEHQVVILHVMQLPGRTNTYDEASPGAIHQLWTESAHKAKTLENKYWDLLKNRGVSKVRCRADGGLDPGQAICRIAAQEKAVLIVIGSRGHYQATRGHTGRVCDHVVRHAPCPVVVFRKESPG